MSNRREGGFVQDREVLHPWRIRVSMRTVFAMSM
jgi:hypothetical protein